MLNRRRLLAIAAALGGLAPLAVARSAASMTRTDEFDYLIIGAGSAGCVLARRLSEGGARVAVLEAGGPDTLPEIHDPLAWPGLQGSSVDWQYKTLPQAQTNDRAHAWARGKVLGGSSSINAMGHQRGHPNVFAEWGRHGATGWTYADLLPYFRRQETFVGGASEFHGGEGPLFIDVPTGERCSPVARDFITAGCEAGYAATDDINGASMEGPTWNHVAIRSNRRQSAAVCYLQPALASANPPTVLTNATVTRLLFAGNRCTGVEYLHDGKRRTVSAAAEVLLAAGSIESPKLLLLAGVGPPEALARHGIAVRSALPGVGQNLQDHLLGAGVVYEGAQPIPVSHYQHGEAMHFLRIEPQIDAPDVLLMCVTVPFASAALPPPPANAYTILPCLMQPRSRGSVALRSTDPLDSPVIDPNYLSIPVEVASLLRGYAAARDIGARPALKAWRRSEIYPGERWRSAADRERFVRASVNTFFHPVGTCAMGTGEQAVVDSSLRVRGVENLRVVDASVMPIIPNAMPHAAVLAIAERAADLLLQESSAG